MRIYFISGVNAALKLGGVYAGLLSKSEQFMDIDINGSIFCEIIPAAGNKLPVSFILDQNFLDNPPENIEVYNLITCYKIVAASFYPLGKKLKVLYQKKTGADSLVTLFAECGTRLAVENQNGFLYENLPEGFEIQSCDFKEFMGEDLIIIEGGAAQKTLIIIDERAVKVIFKSNCDSFKLDQTLQVFYKFSDLAKHSASSKWVIVNGKFTLSEYLVTSNLDFSAADKRLISYLFFEEILCGGDPEAFLSEPLKKRTGELKGYLGEFIDVIPPPFNVDGEYVGLIYRESGNKYYAKYFKVELKDREIVNIMPYLA